MMSLYVYPLSCFSPEQSALEEKFLLAENRVTSSEAGSSEDLQLEVTDLKNQLEQRGQALKQAHVSMDTLTAELEELDRQNQEATQVGFWFLIPSTVYTLFAAFIFYIPVVQFVLRFTVGFLTGVVLHALEKTLGILISFKCRSQHSSSRACCISYQWVIFDI